MRARLAVLSLLLLSPAALLAQQSGIVYQPATVTTIGSYSANCVPKATSSTGLSCGLLSDDGTNVTLGSGAGLLFTSGSGARIDSDSGIRLRNAANTAYTFLEVGGVAAAGQGIYLRTSVSGVHLPNDGFVSWTNTTDGGSGTQDLFLYRDAANTLAQRNGTNAQELRIHGYYVDASNYAYGFLYNPGSGSTEFTIGTNASGSGGSGQHMTLAPKGSLYFKPGNSYAWYMSAAGHLLAITDNTYNIGASASGRPFTVYAAGALISGVNIGWSNGTVIQSPSSGVIGLYNNGSTDFGRLQLGGTTSSFPAIKRNGAAINFRLADDSADAAITAAGATFSGNLLAATDNTYDIGASGANRPRNGYFGGSLVPGGDLILGAGGSYIRSSTSGVILLGNSSLNDFNRLQLGGTTSSFPAIKRNGAGIDFRLADDSNYAAIAAASITSSGQILVGSANTFGWPSRTKLFDNGVNGVLYVADNALSNKVWMHTTGAPSVGGSCGSTPSVAGQDTAMTITAGTGSPTSCAVTFQAAFSTAPSCIANAATTATALNVATTTTTVTVSSAALTAGEKINVLCFGF